MYVQYVIKNILLLVNKIASLFNETHTQRFYHKKQKNLRHRNPSTLLLNKYTILVPQPRTSTILEVQNTYTILDNKPDSQHSP